MMNANMARPESNAASIALLWSHQLRSAAAPFDRAANARALVSGWRALCKYCIKRRAQILPSHRDGIPRSTLIQLSAIHQAMVSVVEEKVRCALGIKCTRDVLCGIKEVWKAVPNIARFGRHQLRGVCRIRCWIIRADGRNRQALWDVRPADRSNFVANVLHEGAVVTQEHHEKRAPEYVCVRHAKPSRIVEIKRGALRAKGNHGALKRRHAQYRTMVSPDWRPCYGPSHKQ
jgi:hypothetical protein